VLCCIVLCCVVLCCVVLCCVVLCCVVLCCVVLWWGRGGARVEALPIALTSSTIAGSLLWNFLTNDWPVL